ncbi:hypothetical protein P154DRAFT_333721 [Amniculicola lignicola CBS 123094]|uniref:1-alkyl-2-acetylglycerophosphocholine esterase n=1 Tax=Amniculicola lignicola CBS 123094 TaxID=1392246 RepID=A0A6A5W6W0_9PLEO|nr:hypothetical protein P154DRAFT_333721 [Amniculicola lignicola CBS 123094]
MHQFVPTPLRLLTFTLFASCPFAQVLIPAPKGLYAVAQSTVKLVDEARIDPYDPNHGKRNVMISLFYPVPRKECKKTCAVSYMPPMTAAYTQAFGAQSGIELPNGTITSLQLQVCCEHTPSAAKSVNRFPIVLLSPGLQGSRLLYSAMAQKLASAGFIVATLDHTYEAFIVEFPDGTFTPGLDSTFWDPSIPGRLEELLPVRVADGRFVLSQLGLKSVAQKLIPGITCGLDNKRAAFYGHSFGGATAVRALMDDKRFVGAINMDGTQFGTIDDFKQPVILFGRGAPSAHNGEDSETWRTLFDHAKGWKRELSLNQSRHLTFFDLPLLFKVAGISVSVEVVGELDGQRSFDVISKYVEAFMDFTLKGRKSKLFDGPNEAYPEIEVRQP